LSSPPAIPSQCDVVVIGAGMGGLTSAAALAKAGLDVCVLEMDIRPGGYLAGFQRKKFIFDTAIHWLNQCGPGGLVRRVFDYLGPGAPATPNLTSIRRYVGDSFDYLLTDQPDDMRDAFIRDFPSDEVGIRSFFEVARKVGKKFSRICKTSRTPVSMTFREKGRLMLPTGITGLSMLRYSGATEKVLPKYFKSAALREVFCSEESFLSCVVPIGWAYEADFQTPPVGGSQAFPHWLCRLLDGWGTVVSYRSRVSQILLDGKRVAGVRFERRHKGETETHEIRCRYVVASNDLHTLYDKMLPKGSIKPGLLKKIEHADLYDSSVTLSIGLDVPVQDLGFGSELVCLTRDGIPREDHSGADPSKVAISILPPSLRDPSLAPEGKGTLVIYAPSRIEDADRWKTGPGLERGDAYKEYKKQYADVLIDRVVEAVSPDLRDHIEMCDIATPVTHQRYTGNRAGSIMAAKPTGKNIFKGVAQYLTPIDNLILGGHWAEYGGGVPVAVRAGFNSALLVLRRQNPAVFEAMKGLLDGEVEPADVTFAELREAVFNS
jgi:prolycopene isomerase